MRTQPTTFLRAANEAEIGEHTPKPTAVTPGLTEASREIWADAVSGFDAVILPTAPNLPPDREALLADADLFAAENLLTLRNTRIGNLLDLPAISLPTGHPGCGLMLLGRARDDRALLAVASGAESALR